MESVPQTDAGLPPCRVRAGVAMRPKNYLVSTPREIKPASRHPRATETAPGSCLPSSRSNLRAHRSHLRARRTSLPAHRTCIPARRSHTPPSSRALTQHTAAAFRVVAPAYRTTPDAFRLAEPTDHHIASAFPTIASSSIRARKVLLVNGLQVSICRKVTPEGREGWSRDSGANSSDSGDSCGDSEYPRRDSGRCRHHCGCNRCGW